MVDSILDNDLYTFTVGQAVVHHYPHSVVEFRFTSRRSTPVNDQFVELLKMKINELQHLRLQDQEALYLRKLSFLKPSYVDFVSNFRFNPSEVTIEIPDKSREPNLKDNFSLVVKGLWSSTIFWEVPLLALISECYYETVVRFPTDWSYHGQNEKIKTKGQLLVNAGSKFADFGTRRRRSYHTQDLVVNNLKHMPGFVGTSNVHLAMKHGVKPIGTMSHQWIMGVSALESLRHANRFALEKWQEVFHGDLGIALPDTFGTKAFFEDFGEIRNLTLAKLFDGIRHDSGCPFEFIDKVVEFYRSIGIDPFTKTIVFSDGLDVITANALQFRCNEKGIKCSFGIGTNFTNDFENSPALNMVIKLWGVRKHALAELIKVVKLSDVLTKATGDRDALRIAKFIFFGTPLDERE